MPLSTPEPKKSLLSTLALALLVILFLAPQVATNNVIPYTDGNAYIQRAFALYGHLHAGQWTPFWNLLTTPRQALLPPQNILFFLLPRACAGLAAYGFIQLICNFGFLALAAWNLCRVFERPAWAPALFLLAACENYAFDYPYFFFLDLTFCAFATLALSLQVDAWKKRTPRAALLAGAAVGLLFWLKPANALLFLLTILLSEILHLAWSLRQRSAQARPILRHAACFTTGLLPLFLLSALCGSLQSIWLILDQNELTPEWITHLPITGLLRLLYFPLCFAYFYNLLVLLALALLLGFAAAFFRRDEKPAATPTPFPGAFLLILLITYTLFGELFSFWILVKTMRALVFLLPLLWLVLFRLAECCRIPLRTLFTGAVLYALLLAGQVGWNFFNWAPLSPDKFYLTDAWYDTLPMAWSRYTVGPPLVAQIARQIAANLPQGGRVGLTTERVFLDGRSLSLHLNATALLEGQPPRYSCVRLLNPDSQYSPNAFLTSNLLIIYVAKNAQYSQYAWQKSVNLLAYIPGHWADPASLRELFSDRGQYLGYIVPLPCPLTPAQLADGMKAAGFPGPMPDDRLDEYIEGRHYSWPEARHLIRLWFARRFGW